MRMRPHRRGWTRVGWVWWVVVGAWVLTGCAGMTMRGERSILVTATAFNTTPQQTDRRPDIGAWGDRIAPGMRVVAVSSDLVDEGIGRGTRVRIEGLEGDYVVLDRMPARWSRRIDIYMGRDTAAARAWGQRRVRVFWTPRESAAGLD